jgi:hypothetical protein
VFEYVQCLAANGEPPTGIHGDEGRSYVCDGGIERPLYAGIGHPSRRLIVAREPEAMMPGLLSTINNRSMLSRIVIYIHGQ